MNDFISVKDWVESARGLLGFNLDEHNALESKYVELYYKTSYTSFFAITDTVQTLTDLWEFYLLEMLPNLQRMYTALYKEYNPIENYNMTETEKTTNTLTNNLQNTNSVENVFGARESSTATTGSDSTTDSVTSYDSNSFAPNNKNEASSAVNSTTTDNAHTDSTTANSTNTGTATTDNNRVLTRSGNIGVTTTQQMLESEILLRQKAHLISDFLCGFADRYFFVPFGVETPSDISMLDILRG